MTIVNAQNYFEQLQNGEKHMQRLHDELIAAGAIWDGMDGYTMPSGTPKPTTPKTEKSDD